MASVNLAGNRGLNEMPKVILLILCAAMFYGIIHDQITVRLCPEYFTLAHPPLFHSASPTLLALGWGSAAAVGIGAVFGVLLGLVSQSPGLPPIPIPRICNLILRLLSIMAVAAALAGCVGFHLSRLAIISCPSVWAEFVPASRHNQFMAVWFAHCASYVVGLGGGAFLIFRIWDQRQRPHILSPLPRDGFGFARAVILLLVLCAVAWMRFWK
jgi:hypothetical protein